MCDGQTTSPHRSQLVVSRSTCPPLSPSPHSNSCHFKHPAFYSHCVVTWICCGSNTLWLRGPKTRTRKQLQCITINCDHMRTSPVTSSLVVISRLFSFSGEVITSQILKKKSFSGAAKDSAIFPFFILLHKRAIPIHPPYLLPPPTHPPIPHTPHTPPTHPPTQI